MTQEIYRRGTLGRAKADLEQTAVRLNEQLSGISGRALVSVNKALVTRASAVIPGVSLYIALLYRAMKARGLHEGCIHQMDRLFREVLFAGRPPALDPQGRIRLDDWEMRGDVQAQVVEGWGKVRTENLTEFADLKGFREEFLRHHGFGMPGIDYSKPVDPTRIE